MRADLETALVVALRNRLAALDDIAAASVALEQAERDISELTRVVLTEASMAAVVRAPAPMPAPAPAPAPMGQLNDDGSVTMPVVPVSASGDELDAAQIVLDVMRRGGGV